MKYKIIGPVAVLGTPPGGTVTETALKTAGTNIEALLGYHLEAVDEPKDDSESGSEGEPGKPTRKRSSS